MVNEPRPRPPSVAAVYVKKEESHSVFHNRQIYKIYIIKAKAGCLTS